MYLKYIEIQGFKSFPDKTRLTFDRVLTGIVGPNGSGKSNISDAVKWVLGEQSTKSLRGGKMEDVIFSGTPERNPMGFAQVSMCLDNSDSRIPDVGKEITVTRRYYRSGDSEYMLNGSPVRLRDLREMFMDTGLGRDGYSVIGQGRISEVVESKSSDRREVFEEASGIAKFRFRKTEAERKLQQTEDNLSRLRDIAGELESRVGPLREQSEKAKKFLEYAEERRALEITLYSDTIKRSRDNISKEDEKIEIARLDYRNLDERFQEIGGE
ncbi:MAG: AAA family ATPase, partial [Oscillospiraceae bacterium]|nr:AAA family ATPase [Oscillospiraceae bacterium]